MSFSDEPLLFIIAWLVMLLVFALIPFLSGLNKGRDSVIAGR